MSGLFSSGGDGGNNTQTPAYLGLNIQSSANGLCVPIIYGRNRVSGNLIWYGAFTAIANTTTQASGGKGGGGGGTSSTTYTYTTSFAMGICEGPIVAVYSGWASNALLSQSDINSTFSILAGGYPTQSRWSYLTSKFHGQDLAYPGTAYLGAANYNLGGGVNLPNFSFEVGGALQYNPAAGIYDAEPSEVINDFLTNPNYGAGFPSKYIGDWSNFASFCVATGIFISPVYSSQQQTQQMVSEITQIANCGLFFSEGKLKISPLSDSMAVGNGVTYTPTNTPLYDLTDDDFITDNNTPPILMNRGDTADAFNLCQVEYLDSSNQYNPAIMPASDLASINAFGLLVNPPVAAHQITNAAVAAVSAQLMLQRLVYIRNTFVFVLSWRYCLLEPGDVVTINDSYLNLSQYAVRINSVEEDGDGHLKITAEDYLAGVSNAPLYGYATGSGYSKNFNIAPSPVLNPVLFECPVELATSPDFIDLWIAAGGTSNYGGCEVWISLDNATYKKSGFMNGTSRYGKLTASLAAAGSAGIAAQTASVALTVPGQILSGTLQDANLLNTLCFVDGEYFAYQTANLTGLNAYDLVTLNRGAYASGQPAHAIGAPFARVDSSIIKVPLSKDYIGTTIYVKLLAFNQYQGATQNLAAVSPIAFPVTGKYLLQPPDNIPWFDIAGDTLTWGVVTNRDLAGYVIRYQYGLSTDWGSANHLHEGIVTQMPYTPDNIPQGQITLMICAIDTTGNVSKVPAYIRTSFGDALVANVVKTFDLHALSYPGTITGCTNISGNLVANSTTDFYNTNPNSAFYSQYTTVAFYAINIYSPMTYESGIIQPGIAAVGSNMTLNAAYTGSPILVEYRISGTAIMFPGAPTDPFYGNSGDPFYDVFGAYIQWPGQVRALNINYQFRFTIGGGANFGGIATCNIVIDVPDILLKLNNLSVPATGLRLPVSSSKFTSIQNVQLTLEADGGSAIITKFLDKNISLGPLVFCYNSSNNAVAGTIDAVVQGY